MKKKTILVAAIAVMLVAALVVGGTLAYFTDTEAAKNTFTVGNVDIELLESSLHRENAGYANGTTVDDVSPKNVELWSDVDKLDIVTRIRGSVSFDLLIGVVRCR